MSAFGQNAPGAFFSVRSSGQLFALPIGNAHSVFRIGGLTRVPLAPAWLLGLTNLRSVIIPVVCLARRLNPSAPGRGVGALAVVTGVEADSFALSVDDVGEVIGANKADLMETPPHMDFEHASLTLGAVKTSSTILPILDVPKLFEFRRRPETAGLTPNTASGSAL